MRRLLLFALVLVACGFGALAAPAAAQQVLNHTWGTDGEVFGVARSGNTLYLGGWFNVVGSSTGGGVPLDAVSGAPPPVFPRVCGSVDVAIPDGEGGWFIGGYFDHVEGEPRAHLAHVLADGRLSAWHPVIEGPVAYNPYDPIHPAVFALALRGNRLYVGGSFTSVNGESRGHLAAFDTRTGELIDWNPVANAKVRCLLLDGATLYAGGCFTAIGASARGRLAAFDERSRELVEWNPAANRPVLALASAGRTLYAGGEFDSIGGAARNSVAAFDAVRLELTEWNAALSPPRYYIAHGNWSWPYVQSIVTRGQTVYLGGWFERAGGQPRISLAALDARTAMATEFDAHLGLGAGEGACVNAVALHGNAIHAGGGFAHASGEYRPNLASFDARSGALLPWNPKAVGPFHKWSAPWDPRIEGVVVALASSGDQVFAGGSITNMYDWQPRGCLAAIDLVTGRVLPWNPSIEGLYTTKLTTFGNAVYLTGYFSKVNGEVRENVAALDAATGALLPWYRDYVYTLAQYGGTLYASGSLRLPSGGVQDYLAPIDPVSAGLNSWLAFPDRAAETMRVTDSTIYFGGALHSVGGQSRLLYAALDRTTGAVLPWAPRVALATGTGRWTFGLERVGDAVYLSGRFVSMGGQLRRNLAAVNAWTGDVLPWAPDPDDLVLALAASGNSIWAGGRFRSIAGEARDYLAALDASSGVAFPWDAEADGAIEDMSLSGDTLVVAGAFRQLGGFPRGGVAAIAGAGQSADAPGKEFGGAPRLALAKPLAFRVEDGRLAFSLPNPGLVSLAIFDLQGRRMATLIEREVRSAGAHEVSVPAAGWSPGVYLCRLEAGSERRTLKYVVLR